MFSAGHANTSISIGQVFQSLGHEVVFIHKQEATRTWWEDVKEIQEKIPCIPLDMALEQRRCDLIIESSFFLSVEQRKKVSHCIWYNRKPGLFTDLESSIYGCRPEGRYLEGIMAIWTADIFTTDEDRIYLQTLYPTIPIYTVPWIWTPDIIETYRKTTGSPLWIHVYKTVSTDTPWSVHTVESNASSTSSCTIPLVTLRNMFVSSIPKPAISRISIHNTDALQGNAYFKENVLKHCSVPDISYSMIGRQRCIDWVYDPHSVILSHSRFVPIKMCYIEAIWVGIPIVHNCVLLRDIGFGLQKLYYSNNSVTGASAALTSVVNSTVETVPYLYNVDALTEVRKKIISMFHPSIHVEAWNYTLQKSMTMAMPMASPVAMPMAMPMPLAKTFTVLFTDMWDNFNESYNMLTLALETALDSKGIRVKGYSIETIPTGQRPDLVVFGPFGQFWKALPMEWPKVHFTGENTDPIVDPSVKLNIGYRLDTTDDSYLRMPLWQFEIDWFGADPLQIKNPIPLPIDTCTTVSPKGYDSRQKFCAFIVTNPRNPVRNKSFTTLNSYKPVTSAGRLYNTIGDTIFAGLGGGGGEMLKHEFLKDYRFCISYENASTPGYTTEKLLHAKAAGCVPIYWGDPKVELDFDTKGFLNANTCNSEEDLIRLVREVEENPVRWSQISSVPALSNYSTDCVRRNFSEMVQRFLKIAGRNELSESVPIFLGAKTSADALALQKKRNSSLLFVTGATQKFWPSALKWLESLESSYKESFSARVYVGADVTDSSIASAHSLYSFAEFIRFPSDIYPSTFTDFWNPMHYAWKLWIYKAVVTDPTIHGKTVFYMDSGSILVGWPTTQIQWVKQAQESGISFLDDCRQKNRNWCHTLFCDTLAVTESEKESQQIAACLILFVAGHPRATKLFTDAFALGQQREIVVGEKWQGFHADGKPFGHRHDQSILSILSARQGICRFPIDKIYGDMSLHDTLENGQSVYVHRGRFQTHVQVVPGIDLGYYINLNRREDRKTSFLEHHSDLRRSIHRSPACDGKTLTLTPTLVQIFRSNDFFWKKAVMGCAISHLNLWSMLLQQPSSVQSMLILEDDVRLNPTWREAWAKAYPTLPPDWDCIYLGGVLPPNRAAYLHALEPVSPGLARVAPNQIFGQKVPTRYCHFCAYAYVLSKRGAAKILLSIQERGYWTSADHMICNRYDDMNIYVLDPLVAGASQDDDPIYQKAEFNNFSRVDRFDSDLWNNDERFTQEEIECQKVPKVPTVPKVPMVPKVPTDTKKTRFISLKSCLNTTELLCESKWLSELFHPIPFALEPVLDTDTFDPQDNLIAVLIKPNWTEQLEWLNILRKSHTFKILHLSDEHQSDPIHMYSWPEVRGVLRFYNRSDLSPSVFVIPLGYNRQFNSNVQLPPLQNRHNMWAFAGTNWKDRETDLQILKAIQPHYVKYYKEWKDPDQLGEQEYISMLLSSKFVPCPRGQNFETFRFYEALESGCMPLVVDLDENKQWMNLLLGQVPFLKISDWNHAAGLLQYFQTNPEEMEKYRTVLLTGWNAFKQGLKERVRGWISR